jgi:hypothetical protein
MDGATLTARYLEEVRHRGLRASELLGDLPASEFLNAFYAGRYLSRPLFIGASELARLYADVESVRACVVSLPDRLFGGNFAAFARAAGAGETFIAAAQRDPNTPLTRLTRADLCADESGFHLLEINMSSAIGGVANVDMCRGLLEHPVLADFARRHDLGYVDTRREQIASMFAETGLPAGSCPRVALADWPIAYRKLHRFHALTAARWCAFGVDAQACHLGELEFRDGRVWLDGRVVDVIARMFYIAHLHVPGAFELVAPVLDAAARGQVKLFASLGSDVFASKATLAMLSDDGNRGAFTAAELASIDRIVPWTRMVGPGQVTLPDGSRGDLLDYAAAHQEDLALKPAIGHGGIGVVLGWDDIGPAQWRSQLAGACDAPFVLQQRVRPAAELFPGETGDLVPWVPVWGMFTTASGYGGMLARAAPAVEGLAVVNAAMGAASGSCLSAIREPGRPEMQLSARGEVEQKRVGHRAVVPAGEQALDDADHGGRLAPLAQTARVQARDEGADPADAVV